MIDPRSQRLRPETGHDHPPFWHRRTGSTRHTGIGLNTPADVHYGHAAAKATQRATVLAEARQRNPERFATTKDPKILAIPATAWINQPAADDVELAA